MAKRDGKTILLGSGKLYLLTYSGSVPTKATLFVDANLAGYIKGGATLEYSEETYEEKDDLGYVAKIITTSEAASLKAGLITWNGMTLKKLVDRCSSSDDSTNGIRTTLIGGPGNAQGGYWAVGFHHADATDGDVWIIIIGRNTAGLSIAFSNDAGSVVEPEFKALPQDSNGTLIQMIEAIPTVASGTP